MAGPRFKDAFQDPGAYLAIEPLFEVHTLPWSFSYCFFCSVSVSAPVSISVSYMLCPLHWWQKERYMVSYNPSKGKVYALLKDQAKSDDILKAAFHVRHTTQFCYLLVALLIIYYYCYFLFIFPYVWYFEMFLILCYRLMCFCIS